MDRDIFKKVHLSDKKRIFRQIATENTLLLLKVEKQDVKRIIVKRNLDDRTLECECQKGDDLDLQIPEVAVINLTYLEDRYFFSGVVRTVQKQIYIDIQGELFYLQRRKSARMEIPDSYVAKAKVLDFYGKKMQLEFKVIDFSSGGCKISLSSMLPLIRTQERFKMLITLGNRSSFEAEVEVRHTKEIFKLTDLPQVLGVQFINSDPFFEGKMLNLYMDVQREIYLKFIKKG
jgi:hypothetical protein